MTRLDWNSRLKPVSEHPRDPEAAPPPPARSGTIQDQSRLVPGQFGPLPPGWHCGLLVLRTGAPLRRWADECRDVSGARECAAGPAVVSLAVARQVDPGDSALRGAGVPVAGGLRAPPGGGGPPRGDRAPPP